MAGRNPFERVMNFIRGPRDEYETPPPPQARPDVRAPRHVDTTPQQRYRVEEGRITQERPGRLDTSGATAPRAELTDAQKAVETKEYLDAVMRSLTEIRGKEAEIVENRYGRGLMGAFRGFNQWLHESDFGRTVKISGKVIGGITMATCAGFLAGTPGIAFSPALALMGKKMAISGAIEAFQYFGGMRRDPETGQRQIGGRERLRRLDMEAGRNMRGNLEVVAQDIRDRYDRGEYTAEEFRQRAMTLVRGMQQNEESILRNDREYEDIRKSNQRVRGLVSTGATMGLGLLTGIPFGIQDLDKDGVFHSVRGAWDGIKWVQGDAFDTAKNWLGQFGNVRELVAGVGSNAANLAGTTEQFWQLAGGYGVAAAGMAAQTFREFGTFAQGSRGRIRELLSENVRIEDGVVASTAGRPTTAMERGPARPTTATGRESRITTSMERRPTTAVARPTTAIERPVTSSPEARPTTGISRATTAIERRPTTGRSRPTTAVEGGVRPTTASAERIGRPTTAIDRATTAAVERGGRFSPLSGKEIQEMPGAARELRTELLNRMGVESAPANAKQEQFSSAFGDWLGNTSPDNVERARVFLEDSLKNYEALGARDNDPRRAALQGALEQISANVRDRATSGTKAPEGRATTTKNPERPTTTAVEKGGQLGTLRGNLKIESFFESGNALFKKDLMRSLQGVASETAIDASAMGVDQWLSSLDAKQLKRLDSYLDRQQKAAEKSKGDYTGGAGSEKTFAKNLQSLQNLRDRISALESRSAAA